MIELRSTRLNADWIGHLIDWIGRSGRWLLETALLSILGYSLFGGLSTVLQLLGGFASSDITSFSERIPALGWWVGFLFGLLRFRSTIGKPFGRVADEVETSEEVVHEQVDGIQQQKTILKHLQNSVAASLIFGLIGGVLGVFAALYLCIVFTAVILCPAVPSSWSEEVRFETDDMLQGESVAKTNESDGPRSPRETSVRFWHPLFGIFFKYCTVLLAAFGVVLGIYLGWNDSS
ncbi:MAG: hypothetical protein AAF802_15470 [Planctomycetota bacterium]